MAAAWSYQFSLRAITAMINLSCNLHSETVKICQQICRFATSSGLLTRKRHSTQEPHFWKQKSAES